MAGLSLPGTVTSLSLGRSSEAAARLVTFLLFAVLQVVEMWVSFLPLIANRRSAFRQGGATS